MLSFLLALVMLFSAFAGCADIQEESTEGLGAESTEISDTGETEETGTDSIDTEETEDTGSETETDPLLEGDYAAVIENAYYLKNGVNAYFPTSERESFFFENQEMQAEYALKGKPGVAYISNKDGKNYIENTMDVFVTLTDGKTYYASSSDTDATANIFRLGYYYYEMRFEDQIFHGELKTLRSKRVECRTPEGNDQCTVVSDGTGLNVVNAPNASDPKVVYTSKLALSTDEYSVLEFIMKADEKATNAQVYIQAGGKESFSASQSYEIILNNDGEYHSYRIPLYMMSDFSGDITALRIDVNGAGASYSVRDVRFLQVETEGLPIGLSLRRSFHTYSDKMHHEMQFATVREMANVAEVGMVTRIDEDKIAKLIVKDKKGTHTTLDGVDWESAEYVGFDIKDAGVFGLILPYDGESGKLSVILEDGAYTVKQTVIPKDNTLKVSNVGTKNANDLYMGQRIYTDESHSFDKFLEEAECERHPLNENFITVDSQYSTNAGFSGYNALRGVYTFVLPGPAGFATSYYTEQNKHYRVNFNIKGETKDRKIYMMTYTSAGTLESAVLLDKNDVMLPVPLEVGKNFAEEAGDRNLFNLDDATYGEVIFPLVIEARSRDNEFSVVNLYQDWGQYPLKQLSWIQFTCPYYHFSTGANESNCIIPYYMTKGGRNLNTLPDFRTMSAPFIQGQPQHVSCGTHTWLEYTDANGSYSASENIYNEIDSYGPTYADVKMDYISDDGRIKVSYIHTEMPQVDENRTYYEIKYEILEDISFKDFSRDFKFYSVRPNTLTGLYTQVGYLNSDNECTVTYANRRAEAVEYTLGDINPYFSFFNMPDCTDANGYANTAFIVYSSEFIIGGEKAKPSFALIDHGKSGKLSLSLALDEVELKAGDSFTINAILLPWGSQESVYDGSNGKYPDQNVRDVRNDSAINPLTAEAQADCERIDSVYLPKLKTTNGESAEFTLSGGNNNVTVRIYGFEKHTVPSVYERINGEWVPYLLNSLNKPDTLGNVHAYDGYCIYYDGDGTFSYSFVATMDNGAPRSFKIVADGAYEPWEKEINKNANREDYLKVYTDFMELGELAPAAKGVGSVEINDIEEFIRIFGSGEKGANEGNIMAYTATEDRITGQYAVIKYRIPKTNQYPISGFQIYTSTASTQADELNVTNIYQVDSDGEWHILAIDLAAVANKDFVANHFVADQSGEYKANFLRFDFFSGVMAETDYIDIAYIGMDPDLAAIAKHNSSDEYVVLLEGDKIYYVDTETGEKQSPGGDLPEIFVHPDSEYKQSELPYVGHIDFFNGAKVSKSTTFQSDMTVYSYLKKTIGAPSVDNRVNQKGTFVYFSGWATVKGGIAGYKWSVDDGKTWYDASVLGLEIIEPAHMGILEAASTKLEGSYTFTDEDAANSKFQGSPAPNVTGIGADLSAYAGESVNLILAAVPASDVKTLCPIIYVENITVSAN